MDIIEDTLTLAAVDLFLEGVTSTDSQDPTGDSSPQSYAGKKRKPTYYARKVRQRIQLKLDRSLMTRLRMHEEATELHEEVETLRERLAELEAERGDGNARLASTVMQNMRMRHNVLQHAKHMAGLQSMLSSYQASGAYGALETYIHLTAEADHRRRSLLELKAQKIPEAHAYITERIRHMDVSRPHFAVEQFKTPEGHFGFSHFDVTPFEGQTLRGVYDALRYFFDHQEKNISENLGFITIRESDDNEGDPVLQCRLVSTLPTGGELETNMAMFVEYCEHKDSSEDSYGLVTLDYINHDELFPYQPDRRSRLDLNNVIFVTPVH
ncbi:hypothetical protein Poli38472_012349 [Pythium oligandrum]|uniref:Uncharacterized protein n=1 Tax=Pythium oligandrum TaxID=41045 RepID=A0A8K1CQP7_PYTOL|nr:hypothetical protein Poli38472_012349 [Pythium oligandrum]|eukprot:TMW67233.1 hypothetical protein Poli38472_012349 [Pythium oligandrum]